MPRTALTPSTRPETPAKVRRTTIASVLDDGMKLAKVQERKKAAKQLLRELDGQEAELCEKLAKAGVTFGETIAKSKLRLKREWRAGREDMSITQARRQGVLTPMIEKLLKPFITKGDPYEVWTATPLTNAVPAAEVEQAVAK